MSDYYVHEEDGSSHYTLEDGSGDLLRETGDVERSASLSATAGIAVRGFGPFSPSRVSQEPVEVIVLSSSAELRMSQEPVEVIVQGAPDLRMSQEPVEVVMQNTEESVNVFVVYWTVDDA